MTISKKAYTALCLIIVVSIMITSVYAVDTRYKEILCVDCDFTISNGVAECIVWAECASLNKEIRVTMVLYQDDNDYATWTYSELFSVDAVETCYVTQGHEYYLGIYVAVYDPNGNFIEDVIAYTDTYYY